MIPCTREATLVHMIDNLGGRLGSFDRLEKGLPDGERWSAFDKGIGGGAFFAGAPAAEAADAAVAAEASDGHRRHRAPGRLSPSRTPGSSRAAEDVARSTYPCGKPDGTRRAKAPRRSRTPSHAGTCSLPGSRKAGARANAWR